MKKYYDVNRWVTTDGFDDVFALLFIERFDTEQEAEICISNLLNGNGRLYSYTIIATYLKTF